MMLFEKIYPDHSTLVKVLKAYVNTHTPIKEKDELAGRFRYYAMPGRNRISRRRYYSLRNNLASYYMRLGRRLAHSACLDSKSAIAIYNRLIDLCPEKHPSALFEYRASPAREIARIHLKKEDLDEAGSAFKKLEEDAREGLERWHATGGLGKDADRYRYWIRSAMIGQADVLLRRSELKAMAALCSETSKVQRRPMRPALAAAKRASHRTTVEDLLRRDWPEDAMEQLHLMEVEFPRNKMQGITEFLRAKAHFALRNFNQARKSLRLCLRLLDLKALENTEVRYLDAEALFQMDKRAGADAAFKKFIEVYPDSEFAELARRRLEVVSVLRLDIGMEGEPFLIQHTSFLSYPIVDHVAGYGGNYRVVHRWAVLTYEIPIPSSTERIRLRFRKKGVALVHINDKKFWQEPHNRRDEGVVDQELLIANQAEWASGKIKITFRDGLNYGRHDEDSLYVNWLELELLKLD
jgi:tetratricopeptide (TPR) repeat protein